MELRLITTVYCVSFMVFLLVDLVWLKYLAGPFYRRKLDPLLMDRARMTPALIFYLLFVLGNLVFVVRPSLVSGSPGDLVFRGVLYGVVCYGTYDLTNYATLEDWPLSVTLLDLTWGAFISTTVAVSGYFTGLYLQ